jgi:hypothetical protein
MGRAWCIVRKGEMRNECKILVGTAERNGQLQKPSSRYENYLRWFVKITNHAPGILIVVIIILFHGSTAPSRPGPPHYRGFTITLDRTPLDEWSARRRDLYLAIPNDRNRQTSMNPAFFEPKILASERPHTHALDCAAAGLGGCYRNKLI